MIGSRLRPSTTSHPPCSVSRTTSAESCPNRRKLSRILRAAPALSSFQPGSLACSSEIATIRNVTGGVPLGADPGSASLVSAKIASASLTPKCVPEYVLASCSQCRAIRM
jgi:hypothetical protein